MTIEVHLFATFARYLPPGSEGGYVVLDVPDDATVDHVVAVLGIPGALGRVALINGREAAPQDRLAPADVVTLFPPLAGGATSWCPARR